MFLADERARVGVNVLDRLGIGNHKVLLLRNQVTNHDTSQLRVMYSEEAMNFEHLSILLLPSDVRFSCFFKVDICEVTEERVTLLWAWDVRDRDALVLTVDHAKETYNGDCYSCMQERGLESTFEGDLGCHLEGRGE
jgi:hypothetical protein